MTKMLSFKFRVYKIMVSYKISKLCILHLSVNILRPACVDWKQNKELAAICIEGGVKKKKTFFSQKKKLLTCKISLISLFALIVLKVSRQNSSIQNV